jgi:hypothetical protein
MLQVRARRPERLPCHARDLARLYRMQQYRTLSNSQALSS